jgi:signal transduction histidine kinase
MTPSSAHPRGPRFAQSVGRLLLCAAVAFDLTHTTALATTTSLLQLAEVAGAAALLLPARLRPGWATPGVRACVPALLTAGGAVAVWATGQAADNSSQVGLITALLCLMVVGVRGCVSAWAAALSAVLPWGALLTVPWTAGLLPTDRGSTAMLLTLLSVVCIALGGSLRSVDRQRNEAVRAVQRAERMEIAADLHDFVAHHVTGILVQAQMARMLAASPESGPECPAPSAPARLDPVLAGIEQAATEALASMRRLVGVLRTDRGDAAGAAAPVRPPGDPAMLENLVDDFSRVGPSAVLCRAPSVPAALPYEVEAAAFRVVQEALTNVRRHAAATRAEVRIGWMPGAVEVEVLDDGHGSGNGAGSTAGNGLVGMRERVALYGGTLEVGDRAGGGFRVAAHLPSGDGS